MDATEGQVVIWEIEGYKEDVDPKKKEWDCIEEMLTEKKDKRVGTNIWVTGSPSKERERTSKMAHRENTFSTLMKSHQHGCLSKTSLMTTWSTCQLRWAKDHKAHPWMMQVIGGCWGREAASISAGISYILSSQELDCQLQRDEANGRVPMPWSMAQQ